MSKYLDLLCYPFCLGFVLFLDLEEKCQQLEGLKAELLKLNSHTEELRKCQNEIENQKSTISSEIHSVKEGNCSKPYIRLLCNTSCKCPKILYIKVCDQMAYANSADPDQTAPEGAV